MKKLLILLLVINIGLVQAQYTQIPDINFEQILLIYDSEGVLDGQILTSDINDITNLEIINNDNNISDLTGIEDFSALEILEIGFTNCTSVNFGSLNNLIELFIVISPNLESIDISMCPNIEVLIVFENNLTELDISNNINLRSLWCSQNQITNINTSQNINLLTIECDNNQITNLDLAQNLNLKRLNCPNNQLVNLDLSQNNALVNLRCNDNLLKSLDIRNGNNTNITTFKTINNPDLSCIFVDDLDYSTANWTEIDDTSTFVETIIECETLDIESYTQDLRLKIYPNPTTKYFKIDSKVIIKNVKVFTTLSNKVKEFKQQEQYNILDLQKGVYFIKIETNNKKIISRKLIVE